MKISEKELIKNILKEKFTIDNVFEEIANLLEKNKYIKDKQTLIEQLKAREAKMSTGIGNGIAIPHSVSEELTEPKIVILRIKKAKLYWKDALDDENIKLVIAILVPKSARSEHLRILSKLSESLIEAENIKKFQQLAIYKLESFINDQIFDDSKIESEVKKINQNDEDGSNTKEENKKQIRLVGITTCPTGVAHTFLAAKAIEEEAKKRNWWVKIEKEGQITKDKLTEEEIKNADYVLLAVGKGIDEPERFNGKKVLEVSVAKPITKAKEVLDDLPKKAQIFHYGSSANQDIDDSGSTFIQATSKDKKGFGQGPIRHLLTGISYMIPFIAMAGIILGLTTAFGYTVGIEDPNNPGTYLAVSNDYILKPGEELVFGPKSYAAAALASVAGAGFTLFVPILGGYIAYSIAGRHGIAPAMITSYYLNDSSGTALFNWQEGTFGNFSTEYPVALGFFGAIAAGYLIGYSVLWYTKKTNKIESQAFQTINPLLIIPIVFTLLPWVFFAYYGYLPLYWLGVGLTKGINGLVDKNMIWLVGIIMGMMICFDLGGPVNKMAMTVALLFLAEGQYFPLLNGIAAVCVSIPPMIVLLVAYTGGFFNAKYTEEEKVMANSAGIMGFFGITEGSIPFAAKEPKVYIPSFVTAGAVAGGVASQMQVGNNVGFWGGPIIYLSGGMGKSPNHVITSTPTGQDYMSTNYVWALFYFIPLIIGAIVGAAMVITLKNIYRKIDNKNN